MKFTIVIVLGIAVAFLLGSHLVSVSQAPMPQYQCGDSLDGGTVIACKYDGQQYWYTVELPSGRMEEVCDQMLANDLKLKELWDTRSKAKHTRPASLPTSRQAK